MNRERVSSRRAFAASVLAAVTIGAGGCERALPPGLGDQVTDSRLEVVDASGSAWNIGTRLDLSDLEGKPIVLDFWASWCGPCRVQHEYVSDLKARYGDQLEVIGVLFNDTPANAREWLAREGASYPTVMEARGDLAEEFWVSGLPRFVLLDGDRRLEWDYLGASSDINPWSTDSVEVRLARLLGDAN